MVRIVLSELIEKVNTVDKNQHYFVSDYLDNANIPKKNIMVSGHNIL